MSETTPPPSVSGSFAGGTMKPAVRRFEPAPQVGAGFAGKSRAEIASLMNSGQALVRSLAWKTHANLPKSVEIDDLIGYGHLGLAEAARDFDPGRGVAFMTFAYYRVRGAIFDGLSTMSWFTKADYYRGRYQAAANDVLAEEASREGDDVEWFVRSTQSLCVAAVLSGVDPEGGGFEVEDDTPRDESLEVEETVGLIREELDSLEEQERALVEAVYFEGLTIKDAGERIGISKAWASRTHRRALDRLGLRLCDRCGEDRPDTHVPPAKRDRELATA